MRGLLEKFQLSQHDESELQVNFRLIYGGRRAGPPPRHSCAGNFYDALRLAIRKKAHCAASH
jgi:hypothetical protein